MGSVIHALDERPHSHERYEELCGIYYLRGVARECTGGNCFPPPLFPGKALFLKKTISTFERSLEKPYRGFPRKAHARKMWAGENYAWFMYYTAHNFCALISKQFSRMKGLWWITGQSPNIMRLVYMHNGRVAKLETKVYASIPKGCFLVEPTQMCKKP